MTDEEIAKFEKRVADGRAPSEIDPEFAPGFWAATVPELAALCAEVRRLRALVNEEPESRPITPEERAHTLAHGSPIARTMLAIADDFRAAYGEDYAATLPTLGDLQSALKMPDKK